MEVKVPALPGAKTVIVGKVCVKPGDVVEAGQELFAVETKKGNRPIKAMAAGTIVAIFAHEGDELQVGGLLAELEEAKEEEAPAESAATAANSPIEERHAQLLVIGGGTGGYVAAIAAAKQGRKVTLVERNRLGGTCLNRGCIPTKTLIASSTLYERIREADVFGIRAGDVAPDMPKIIARKDAVVERLVGGIEYLMSKNQIETVHGTASFESDASVLVTADKTYRYSFDDCIIATGSVVSRPAIPGIDSPGVLDSTAALECTELPSSIAIIGGGVIGMEFAFLYRALGVEVTVVEFLDRLLSMVDADLSAEILRIARNKGIRVELGARVTGFVQALGGQMITTFEQGGTTLQVVSDKVLVAIGRRPNMEGLGLSNTSIELSDKTRGIAVDAQMRTNVPHIFAVGDVNNLVQLAHAASHQGIIAVDTILGHEDAFDADVVPSVIFTSPEVATVGICEDEARRRDIAYKVGMFHYMGNGKALSMNETEGYVKLLKDEHDVVIGGAIIGADASTLIATVALAVTNHMSDADIRATIFAHPTTAEVVHEAALDLSLGAFHE